MKIVKNALLKMESRHWEVARTRTVLLKPLVLPNLSYSYAYRETLLLYTLLIFFFLVFFIFMAHLFNCFTSTAIFMARTCINIYPILHLFNNLNSKRVSACFLSPFFSFWNNHNWPQNGIQKCRTTVSRHLESGFLEVRPKVKSKANAGNLRSNL